MTVWVVRGGRYGEREAEALDNGFLTIGFGLLGDLSVVSGRGGSLKWSGRLYQMGRCPRSAVTADRFGFSSRKSSRRTWW